MKKKYKWGIIGLGKIAHKFAHDLLLLPDAILKAVASRSLEKATTFGEKFGVVQCFGSYDDFFRFADVDVVYIATPHIHHLENALRCVATGRAVLCEKPLYIEQIGVNKLLQAAYSEKIFAMEAIWTRFLPFFDKLLRLVKSDNIGNIKLIKADFGFNTPFDEKNRVFQRELGGGALLDVGIYPLFLAQYLLGSPKNIVAQAKKFENGIDETVSVLMQYENGALAVLDASIGIKTPCEAWIHGTQGSVRLHSRFHETRAFSLYDTQLRLIETVDCEYVGYGYHFEAAHVQVCLSAGWTESPALPLDFSSRLAGLMDEVRRQIGVDYGER